MAFDLERLKLAFVGGTPGEWTHGWDGQSVIVAGGTNGRDDCDRHYGGKLVCESVTMLDQAAIIAMRSAVPDLVAEVERLRATVAQLEEANEDAWRFNDHWVERAGDLQAENGRLANALARTRLSLALRTIRQVLGEIGCEVPDDRYAALEAG